MKFNELVLPVFFIVLRGKPSVCCCTAWRPAGSLRHRRYRICLSVQERKVHRAHMALTITPSPQSSLPSGQTVMADQASISMQHHYNVQGQCINSNLNQISAAQPRPPCSHRAARINLLTTPKHLLWMSCWVLLSSIKVLSGEGEVDHYRALSLTVHQLLYSTYSSAAVPKSPAPPLDPDVVFQVS